MAKDGKKSSTTDSTAEARAIRQALRISYEVRRAEWLSGHMPMMPPPWAKPVTEFKPRHTREGKQMPRLLPVLRELYPPDGMPPGHVKTVAVMQCVLKEYQARGWGEVSRDVVEKAIGRGRYRRT